VQAELALVEVERSLSYVKYANEQQRVVVGGSVFEWQKEADFRKSDKLMGKDSKVWEVMSFMRRMRTGRAMHCKGDWSISAKTLSYLQDSDIQRSMCATCQESTIDFYATPIIE